MEVFGYVVFGGIIPLILLAILAVLLLPLTFFTGVDLWLMRLLKLIVLFASAFFLGGAINIAWFLLFSERLYHMADPLVHFTPFFPFGWWSLDRACGGHLLHSTQMWHLRLLWFICAIAVWAFSTRIQKRLMSCAA